MNSPDDQQPESFNIDKWLGDAVAAPANAQMEAISRNLSDAMRHQANAEGAMGSRLRPSPGDDINGYLRAGRDPALDALNDELASNEKRRVAAVQRKTAMENESIANSRKQIEALEGVVSLMGSQIASSTRMERHQRKMNWWILSLTGAGVLTAIGIKVFGG